MTLLEQYQANLEKLELQAAQYGMDVPLALLNNIEYHKQKIEELRNVQPTINQTVQQSKTNQDDIYFQDDFQSNGNHWLVGEETLPYGTVNRQIVDGVYRLTLKAQQAGLVSSYIPEFYGEDFILEFSARIIDATGFSTTLPVLFATLRNALDGSYMVFLYEKGYGIAIYSGNNPLTNTTGWVPSNDIPLAGGQVVRFSLKLHASTLTIEANGNRVAVMNDSTVRHSGAVWLGLQIFEPNCSATVEFSNIVVRPI